MSLLPLLVLTAAAFAVGVALLVAAGAPVPALRIEGGGHGDRWGGGRGAPRSGTRGERGSNRIQGDRAELVDGRAPREEHGGEREPVPAEGRPGEDGGMDIPAGRRAGRRALRALRETMSLAPAAIVVGLVALHALLLGYDAAGVPWRRRTLAAGMVALFLVAAVAAAWQALRRRAASGGRAIPDGDVSAETSGPSAPGAEHVSGETSQVPAPGIDHVSAETSAGSAPGAGHVSAETSRPSAPAALPLPPRRLPFGWGDPVALAVVAVYAGAAYTRRIGIPDFVYHWGLKAKRYALAGGIDWAWLADPLRLTDHPDYPNLLPGLYAATAHVLGTFDEGGLLLWSAAFFGLIVLFARQAVAHLPGRFAPQAAVATVALAVGMFGIGYDMAGGADWMVALALLAAAPVLLRPAGAAASPDHLLVGAAAALAAGAKIEGVPLAAFLVAVHLLRVATALPAPAASAASAAHGATGRSSAVRRLGRLARSAPWVLVPPALVILPWLAGNLRHGLFQSTNTGTWDADRLGAVAAGLVATLGTPEWHGLPWLLVLLPALLALRRTRALSAVLALQLLLYLGIYLTAPVDTRFYVLSSFPRLAFHLVPALLVTLAVLLVPPREEAGAAETP